MGQLKMGQVYRYSQNKSIDEIEIDDLPNFFHIAGQKGLSLPLLEKGISQVAPVKDPLGEKRYPVIIISSSPHKSGSELNPWHDVYSPDTGYARYFGDAKGPGDPSLAPGNKLLLTEFAKHSSGERSVRETATPMIFFERVNYEGRPKGNIKFHGFGVIERAELVTQYNPKIGYFTNYVFEFAILSLTQEEELFDWAWLNERRNTTLETKATLEHAPQAWKQWLKTGSSEMSKIRRRVAKSSVQGKEPQLPIQGTPEWKCLNEIYDFYTKHGKHRFELLASRVVMSFVNSNGGSYDEGWITRGSGDGGVDFVGKIRVGAGFASTQIIVLGQAKCEKINTPTNGQHIARTIARLKRGWVGAYVTTSYFSEASQLEIIEDEYPLITINGLVLAEQTLKLAREIGYKNVLAYLEDLEIEYPTLLQSRRPEELLLGDGGIPVVANLTHG